MRRVLEQRANPKNRLGGIFLWHSPQDHSYWPLTSALPYGARTFLTGPLRFVHSPAVFFSISPAMEGFLESFLDSVFFPEDVLIFCLISASFIGRFHF